MGQAKLKSKSQQAILKSEARCIYCEEPASTIEHMPPRMLFLKRRRPSGLEFAACESCNHGTKGADAVAALFSRISPSDDDGFWQSDEGIRLRHTVDRDAPGLLEEAFDASLMRPQWVRGPSGLLTQKVILQAGGPLVKAYLDVFAAKLAMALYREHVGTPLPGEGGVQTIWYLNHGLSEEHAHAHLSILPAAATLRQGTFIVPEQFAYRYNCDDKSIFAALIGLNKNLHVFVIASSTPETFGLPAAIPNAETAGNFMRPSQLLARLPIPAAPRRT
jgi:hypothetical protein